MNTQSLEDCLNGCFISEHVDATVLDPANIVDVVNKLANNTKRVADAITPFTAFPHPDATGVYVASLTEAVIGVSAGLVSIAGAIDKLADAVMERG